MEHIQRLVAHQKIRYIITGLSAFALEYVTFAILLHALDALFVANSISFLCGLVYSFWLHKRWSFAGKHQHKTHHQFAGYAVLAGVNLVLTNVIIGVLVHHFSIPALIAKVMTMGVIVIWNYVFLSRLLFKEAEIAPPLD